MDIFWKKHSKEKEQVIKGNTGVYLTNSKAIAITEAELSRGCVIREWGSYGAGVKLWGLVWAD